MSTPFYDLASLVVVPSGYKASKVYAQKPLTTDGQLTFSRASTATRVNSAGLIEKVRTNFLKYSEAFDNTAQWSYAGNGTITPNSIANPLNGDLTADTYVVTSGAANVEKTLVSGAASFAFTAGVTYTASAYFKAGTISAQFRILAYDGVSVQNSGIVDLVNIGNSTASYVSVGNGWYRFWYTFTAQSGATAGYVYIVNYAYPTAITNGTNVYVYGAQLEVSDFGPTPYIATTSAAVSVGPVANVPRLDYLNSSCPRLLLEPQRTNLKLYSEDFSTAAGYGASTSGSNTVTFTANYGTSLDGYQNADRLQLVTIGGGYADWVSVNSISIGTTYTYSVYVKSLSGSASFYFLGGAFGNILKTATTEWTRLTYTFTATDTACYPRFLLQSASSPTADLLVWGAQLEAGAYATSYIPTLGAAVTRLADACSKTGISSLIGQTEGTIFYDFVFKTGADTTDGQFGISAAAENDRVIVWNNFTLSTLGLQIKANSTNVINNVSLGTFVDGTTYKMAVAYKSGSTAVYVNGTQVYTSSTTFTFAASLTDFIVGAYGTSGFEAHQKVNQALLFKTRLTNAQLAELTTL